MSSLNRLADALDAITYAHPESKEVWSFKLDTDWGYPRVHVRWAAPGIGGCGEARGIGSFMADDLIDLLDTGHVQEFTDRLGQYLLHAIDQLESHERLECLRVDGAPLFDPHPRGETATRPLTPARIPSVLSR